jgi:type 1 fimbria pilin
MDTNNLYTEKQNFLVVLDSRNADTYNNGSWNSSIIFNLESIAIPKSAIKLHCSVLSFISPNSIYNINEYNNKLTIFISSKINYLIPYGNYNVNTFITTLLSLLPIGFTLTWNSINNILTLSYTSSFSIHSDSNIGDVMGFTNGITYSGTIINMPYTCNFNGLQSLNINFTNLNTSNIDSHNKTTSPIIQPIQIIPNSAYISFNKTHDYYFTVNQDVIDYIQIDLNDDLDRLINFNNQHWNLTLYFSIINDIDRFAHRNNFNNILTNGYYNYYE